MINFGSLWTGMDWIVIVLYFVGVLGVGVMMHRRASKNFKSFFVASRKLTVPVLIGVAAAGWYDSWSIVGVAECGWTMGISIVFIYILSASLLRLPLAVVIGPMCRDKLPDYVLTVPDMISYFYDKRSKFVAAFTVMVTILYDAALLFAVGDVMHLVTGVTIWGTMVVAGGVIVAYTAMAGLWGLAVTDMIQFAIMTVAAGTVSLGIALSPGGLSGVYDSIRGVDPVLLTPLGHNTGLDVLAWVIAAASLYVYAQSYQRFGAAKGGAEIKIAYAWMLIVGTCFSTIMALAGMTASVMFPTAASPAEGFWAMIFTILPTGLRGLFVAALCAAVMSTVSADFLICSTAMVKDLYASFFNPKVTDAGLMKGSRYAIVFSGIFCVIGTYFWQDGIGKAWYYLGGFQVAVFFIPIIGGLFYKKKTATGGFIAILCTMVAYVAWEFILKAPYGIPSNVAAWTVSLVTYFIACNATYNKTQLQV